MTTRLDRLLLLLSTGSTPLVRQAAAKQLGHIASVRIARVTHSTDVSSLKVAQEALLPSSASTSAAAVYRGLDGEWSEVVNLIAKVLPYLRDRSWETRSAAALAIECIVKAAGIWEPPKYPAASQHDAISLQGQSGSHDNLLARFDLVQVLQDGPKLLASSGNEYAGAGRNGAQGKLDLVKQLGLSMPGAGEDDIGIDVEKELLEGEASQQQHQEPGVRDAKGKGKGRAQVSDTPPEDTTESRALSEDPMANLSARERAALKRKRKAGHQSAGASVSPAPQPPPSSHKKRIVEASATSSASYPASTSSSAPASPGLKAVRVKTEEDEGGAGGDASESVTVSFKGKVGGQVDDSLVDAQADAAKWCPPPEQWPFSTIVEALKVDVLHPSWEVRHGALMALREIVKTQGGAGGALAGPPPSDNAGHHSAWCEDLAASILRVFALDRFGDFVGDQVVAPVRETASQALSALLVHMPPGDVRLTQSVLMDMVAQTAVKELRREEGRRNHFWEVRHAGLLGLKYLVAVRRPALVPALPKAENQNGTGDIRVADTFSASDLNDVLDACCVGLGDPDDDVRAAAASVLLPVVDGLVSSLPDTRLLDLLNILSACLSELGDDLSSSVGNIMDLLAEMLRHTRVLDLLQGQSQGWSLSTMIHRLYPFCRHTIPSVRLAVMNAVKICLAIPTSSGRPAWIDDRLFRLVFQNLIVEEKLEIRMASSVVWSELLRILVESGATGEELGTLCRPHLAGWFDVLMTPVGTAINTRFFWKYSSQNPDATGSYSVDKAILLQDMALVTPEQTLRGRLAAATALSGLLYHWPPAKQEADWSDLLYAYLTSASSHQISFSCIVVEEWAHHSHAFDPAFAPDPWMRRLSSRMLHALESPAAVAYSETSGLLQQTYTLCTQLLGIFKNKGKVPAGKIPDLGGSAHAFTLQRAAQVFEGDYRALMELVKGKERAAAVPLLEEVRGKIHALVNHTTILKEAQDVQVFSALAGACIGLRALPSKMNPLIRSVMNGLKFEVNPDLQSRAARSIANFIEICKSQASPVKNDPSDKIVKNVCTFLCQDQSITPLFSASKGEKNAILSLKHVGTSTSSPQKQGDKNAANGTAVPDDTSDPSSAKTRLVRRGAEMAVRMLSERYEDRILAQIPKLWSCMSEGLLRAFHAGDAKAADSLIAGSEESGQDVLDCLTILGTVTSLVVPKVYQQIETLLPKVVLGVQSDFAVVRHVSAKTLATMCESLTEAGMKHVVLEIVPTVADPLSVARRKGAIELFHCLIEQLDTKILPYVIFLVVPVLGRMTDSDDDVRALATSTFAALVKLVPLEAGLPDPPGFSEELLQKRSFEREFLTQLLDGSKVERYELPIKISVQLRKYQQEGINWLAFLAKYQLHGILCDDMGLGKTLQSICIMASKTYERAERFAATQSPDAVHLPNLVVCPPTLTGHWQHEIRQYATNLNPIIYGGDRSERLRQVKGLTKYDVVVTSYDVVRNDIEHLSQIEWNYCILDEGHIIKNGKTKLALAVKSLRANHRLILSGTPIQNNVLELWSLFDFLMPGFLGTEEAFNRRFSKPIQRSRDAKSSSKEQEAGALALEALHKQVLPFLLRRLKENVLDDLPPKIIQDYYCDLSPLQRDLYETFAREKSGTEEDSDMTGEAKNVKDTHVFQMLQYLRKLVNHPTLVLNNTQEHLGILQRHRLSPDSKELHRSLEQAPKLLALKQLLQDSGIGVDRDAGAGTAKSEAMDAVTSAVAPHRVLIFCQMKAMLDLIESTLFALHMPTVSYMRMDGSTPTNRRHSVTQTFNSDPSIDVLLLTTSVGGLGLNLTGADTVIFVEHDWNPSKDLQAMDRAHRLGQKRTVNVYRLITRGTLEEKIMGLQRFKLNIAGSVVTQQNASLDTMGTDNVLDLFSLDSNEHESKQQKTKASGKGPMSQKALLESLQDLDDGEDEYKDFASADQFVKSLQ